LKTFLKGVRGKLKIFANEGKNNNLSETGSCQILGNEKGARERG